MKQNRSSDENKDLLSLGSVQEEIQEQKQLEKKFKLPAIMIISGIILIMIGTFYTNIDDFIKNLKPKQETKQVKKEEGVVYLTCEYKSNNETLGISNKTQMKYEFKNNQLKKLTTSLTMEALENSEDIGESNLKIYNQKYKDAFKNIKNPGLIINTIYKEESLKNIVIIDFEKIDLESIPQNEYLSITNKKDQSYREIKEIEGRAGHICKTT